MWWLMSGWPCAMVQSPVSAASPPPPLAPISGNLEDDANTGAAMSALITLMTSLGVHGPPPPSPSPSPSPPPAPPPKSMEILPVYATGCVRKVAAQCAKSSWQGSSGALVPWNRRVPEAFRKRNTRLRCNGTSTSSRNTVNVFLRITLHHDFQTLFFTFTQTFHPKTASCQMTYILTAFILFIFFFP